MRYDSQGRKASKGNSKERGAISLPPLTDKSGKIGYPPREMGGKAFGRITRGERCRGQRHAVSISLVPEIRMFSSSTGQE